MVDFDKIKILDEEINFLNLRFLKCLIYISTTIPSTAWEMSIFEKRFKNTIKLVTDKISNKEINLYRFRIRGKKFTFFWILVGRNNS